MNVEESLEKYGLVPSNESLPAIRQLLVREAELERLGDGRTEDLALLCCVQLFSRGLLEDIWLIWDAKHSGFDLACYLDWQFVLGAGVEETVIYLRTQNSPAAADILLFIEVEQQQGDELEDWSPAKHLEFYRGYFFGHPKAET